MWHVLFFNRHFGGTSAPFRLSEWRILLFIMFMMTDDHTLSKCQIFFLTLPMLNIKFKTFGGKFEHNLNLIFCLIHSM